MQNLYNFQNQPQQRFYAPPNNGINWVQGIEGAKAYQLAPNSNTMLLDSENEGIFYIKVADNVGMCSLRVFKYQEVNNTPQPASQIDTSQFVTRDELAEIIEKLKEDKAHEQTVPATKPTKKQLISE